VRPVPPVERGQEPTSDASEEDLLVSWLEWHRATMVKCEGLTVAQLGQRSCPPSELTLLGLVRHLTEIERSYSPFGPESLISPTTTLMRIRTATSTCPTRSPTTP
jgi:Protein of unknown function (DUF664)